MIGSNKYFKILVGLSVVYRVKVLIKFIPPWHNGQNFSDQMGGDGHFPSPPPPLCTPLVKTKQFLSYQYEYPFCRSNRLPSDLFTADPNFSRFLWITRFLWIKRLKHGYFSILHGSTIFQHNPTNNEETELRVRSSKGPISEWISNFLKTNFSGLKNTRPQNYTLPYTFYYIGSNSACSLYLTFIQQSN